MLTLNVAKGAAADWLLQAADRSGGVRGGFDPESPLSAVAWPGGDRSPVFEPSVSWVDAEAGTFRLSVEAEQTAVASLSSYRLRVTTTLENRPVALADVVIVLDDEPGERDERRAYCTVRDLRRECGWIAELFSDDADESGFSEQLASAADWLDNIIISAYGESITADKRLREALDNGGLVKDGARGRAVARACANYAGSLIARANPGEQPQRAAAMFAARASRMAACLTVDVAIGSRVVSISLGRVNIRRG